MHMIVSGLLILLFMLGSTPHASAQASAVDPASLIGEWHGTMTPRGSGRGRGAVRGGDYVLTISGVEGNKVRGKVVGPDEGASGELKDGVIEKDTLSFSTGGAKTQLTIKGESMEGTRVGGGGRGAPNEWTVSITKKK